MQKSITNGRIQATINLDGEGSYFVLVTRDGQCLPGILGNHYTTLKRAETGAARMMAKAA